MKSCYSDIGLQGPEHPRGQNLHVDGDNIYHTWDSRVGWDLGEVTGSTGAQGVLCPLGLAFLGTSHRNDDPQLISIDATSLCAGRGVEYAHNSWRQ